MNEILTRKKASYFILIVLGILIVFSIYPLNTITSIIGRPLRSVVPNEETSFKKELETEQQLFPTLPEPSPIVVHPVVGESAENPEWVRIRAYNDAQQQKRFDYRNSHPQSMPSVLDSFLYRYAGQLTLFLIILIISLVRSLTKKRLQKNEVVQPVIAITELGTKKYIAKQEKRNVILLTLFEIGLSILILHLYLAGGYENIGIIFLLEILVAIVSMGGIAMALQLLNKDGGHLVSIVLLIISIFTLPIISKPIIYRISNSIIEKERAPQIAVDKERAVQETIKQKVLYAEIKQAYTQPQKIVAADLLNEMYPLLLLKNGDVIGLPELVYDKRQEYVNFIKWIDENLLNKEITIILPDYENYDLQAYIGINPCENDNSPALITAMKEKFHQSVTTTDNNCSILQAEDIYYDDKSLYKRFIP